MWYNENTFKLIKLYCNIRLDMKILSKIKNWFFPTKENNFNPSLLSDRAISIFILLFLLIKIVFSFNLILVKQSSLFADVSAQKIFSLTNEIRQQYGLSPVTENNLLNQAAQYKAEDMLKNSYFNHYSPDGKAPWDWISAAKYNYKYAGENLALNFYSDQEAVEAWLNSPSHKENILNPNYKDTGVAIFSGITPTTKENRTIVVQMFGTENINNAISTIKTSPVLPTTTSTIVSTTTNFINNTEKESIEIKENKITLLKSIAPIIKEQSNNKDQNAALSLELVKNVISPESIKKVNNSFGLGLLFLGIFGIINIGNQNNIATAFKRKLFLKNAFVLIIGLGFLLNNITNIIYKIKIPTI